MAYQFIRGTTAENDAYVGPIGSFSIDTELGNIRLHDGVTPGGRVIANVDEVGRVRSVSSNSPILVSGTVEDPVVSIQEATPLQNGYLSSSDKGKLDGIEAGAEANVGDTFDSAGTYLSLRAQATTKGDVGLGSVDNFSRADYDARYAQLSGASNANFANMPWVSGDRIVNSGSNSGGQWVQFSDGTQICYIDDAGNMNTADSVGAVYRASVQLTWTFPISFVGKPSVSMHLDSSASNRWTQVNGVSPSSASLSMFGAGSSSTGIPVGAMAIGRWK